jgi:hypothetical protein
MSEKNQLADIRKLISLPPGEMKRKISRFADQDPYTMLRILFKLIRTEKLSRQKKNNALALTKFLLQKHHRSPLAGWLKNELNTIIDSKNISHEEKAIILSAFEPEDLIDTLDNFKDFVEGFTDIIESFEKFLVNQLRSNPSRLYDIYKVLIEKSKPEGLLAMVEDLAGSEEPEVLQFLELLTYRHDSIISWNALKAIEMASTQDAISTLHSISCLNPVLKKEAEGVSVSLMHELPLPAMNIKSSMKDQKTEKQIKSLDLWVSLIDGNGALSIFIGKKFERNNYFIASILMKSPLGIKDTNLMSNLTRKGYEGIKREYFSELSYYPVQEEYLLNLIMHYLRKGLISGSSIPMEVIILKNVMGWKELEPMEYFYSLPEYDPLKYYPRDLFQFPFETWWIHDFRIYSLLKPHRGKQIFDIPDDIFFKITDLFLEYARRELVPACEICADIIRNSRYHKRTRLTKLFLKIRDEILHPPKNIFQSAFINFAVVATIDNTLHNLSLGIETPECVD